MILIKIGGSLIAPKDKIGYINAEYLQHFYEKIETTPAIIVHGTGNVGHGFIQKYGLSKETASLGRETLDRYFSTIDTHFLGYKRIGYTEKKDRSTLQETSIIGGDITPQLNIISSDKIFAEILAQKSMTLAIIATDVDGVLDKENKIIPVITSQNIDTIHFRSKQGDVTGSMKEKIHYLIQHNAGSGKKVRICNGYDLENMEHIITTGQGKGTQVLL